MPGLYQARAATLITGDLGHVASITAKPLGVTAFDFPAEAVTVTFAEDWAPHIQAKISGPIPTEAQLALLDPRKNCRLDIKAGYRYGDGTLDLQMLANLGIRSGRQARPGNTLDIDASSDEARAMDRQRVESTPLATFTGINDVVQQMAAYAVYPETVTVSSDFPAAQGLNAVAGLTAPVGTPMWDIVEDAAARAGVWVHCNDARVWRVRYRPSAGTSQHTLEVGKNGTIDTTDVVLDRTGWANQAINEYTWTDTAGATQKMYGRSRVSGGAYSVDTVGYKTDTKRYNRAATQTQANTAADSRVKNLVTRGRGVSLSAHSAYWLRPGQTITVILTEGGTPETHIIKSISFNLGTGWMDITTRQPNDATTTTGE